MDIEKKLALLQKIHREEAPPFLYTRILASIDSRIYQPAPVSWKLCLVAAFSVVIALNVSIFLKPSNSQNSHSIDKVVSNMELSTENELYHD